MEEKANTGGCANSLGGILKDVRQKAKRNNLMCSALKKVANLNNEELYDFLKPSKIEASKNVVHEHYQPTKLGIVINEMPARNRRAVIEEATIVCDPFFMNEIVDRCDNGIVPAQELREDKLIIGEEYSKYTKTIVKELNIKNSSPDAIIERIICLYPYIEYTTIIGFCCGFTIYMFSKNGKTHIKARITTGWYKNVRIIH